LLATLLSKGRLVFTKHACAIVVGIAVALWGCGKSESDDDGTAGGEAGASERGGAGPSGGNGGGGTGGGGSSGAAGSGGEDPCAPGTCESVGDCAPVTPQSALITDFSMLNENNAFHSESKEWWLEFYGGAYVYPGFDQCAETQVEPRLEQSFDGESWHITGTVATYAGAGLWLAPCNVDMSAYSGISFTISGNVGPTGTIVFAVGTAANMAPSTNPRFPNCHPNQNRCVPADPEAPWESCAHNVFTVSGIHETPLTVTIPWVEFIGGMPEATTNPTEIREIGFALDWQFAYTEADAYAVDLTVDDVTLVE
jgi:hypothetical protein